MRSSRKLRSPSRVRSHVCTRQFGSDRSSEYGSTVRFDHVCSPSFWYSISTSLRSRIASLNVATSRSSSEPTCGSGVCVSSNLPNVSSSFRRTRSSGVCAAAALAARGEQVGEQGLQAGEALGDYGAGGPLARSVGARSRGFGRELRRLALVPLAHELQALLEQTAQLVRLLRHCAAVLAEDPR